MKYRNTPLKQTTNVEEIPGFDGQGRKGTIKITTNQNPGERTNFSSDPVERAKQKQWIKDNPDLYQELLEKKKRGTKSQKKSFTPDTITTEGKPGTTVDTFTAPNTRETIRTGKITANKMANMAKKQGRIQNRAVNQGFGEMKEVLDADGNPTGEKEFQLKKLNPGDKGYNKYRRFKENLAKVENKRAKVEKLDDTIDAAFDAGVNARNRSDFEYGTKKTGPVEGGEVKDVQISDDEKQSGDYANYDEIETFENKPIMEEDDSPAEMKSSAFKMKYNHSPSKMYTQAKEKSSALKMWGASKVEDGNKLFFDKSLFKGQNKATRPMTNKASAFKMKGYNK
jgi:hypothetical protein|tara:strand:- start:201 stop:1217 length:1017 start_codon:yes stop_codon:yes gene_type:complete